MISAKMIQHTLIILFALILVGCGSPQPTRNYDLPTYANPATSAAEPVTELATEDANSGFASDVDNIAAKKKIEDAVLVFEQSKQTAVAFIVKRKMPSKCDATEMESTLRNIQEIEIEADKYTKLSIAGGVPSEREAAMDVADELNSLVLDSYFEVALAYKTAKCFARAQFLLEEIRRIYVGASFEKWHSDAVRELAAIPIENPLPNKRRRKKI
jgi:hypothetical protein